jgi:hypothetical protein
MESIVIPYLFEKYLIMSLDYKWLSLFDGRLSFKVCVDKKRRLCLISEQRLK